MNKNQPAYTVHTKYGTMSDVMTVSGEKNVLDSNVYTCEKTTENKNKNTQKLKHYYIVRW